MMYVVTVLKFIEIENRVAVGGGLLGKEMKSYCLSFTKWRVLEIDDGDNRTTLWMHLIPPNCILKNG